MAWQRTALGVGGVGLLLLHQAGGGRLAAVPGALGLVVASMLLVATERRYRRTVHRVRDGRPATSRVLVRLVAVTTVLLAVAALAVVLVG